MAHSQPSGMQLSAGITGATELNRVLRELKWLDDQMAQQSIRHTGASVQLPPVSNLLDELAAHNKLDLTSNAAREELKSFIENTKAHAPTVHIGFDHEALGGEVAPIVAWIRAELGGTVLVHIGVQPGIIGGCTIRTPNHFYDFSLKQHFETARVGLLEKVRAL